MTDFFGSHPNIYCQEILMVMVLMLKKKLLQLTRRLRHVFLETRILLVRVGSCLLPSRQHLTYDCFLFNNEVDLLKLRILELNEHVDYFVVCECATTFSGCKKNLHYAANKEHFIDYQHKIIHFVIPAPPKSAYVNNKMNSETKKSEYWQRNQMAYALKNVRDHDFILISDVDEIPNPRVFASVYKLCYWARCIAFFDQAWYQLFLNVRVIGKEKQLFASHKGFKNKRNDRWLGTFATTAGCLRQIYGWRVNSIWGMKWSQGKWIQGFSHAVVPDAGWHFSYIGAINKNNLLEKKRSTGMLPSDDSLVIQELRTGHFQGNELRIELSNDHHPKSIIDHPRLWERLFINNQSLSDLADAVASVLP